MIIKRPNFKKLFETNKLVVGYDFEYAWLVNKISGKEIYLGGFYGDPSCGIISTENNYCLVGGSYLYLWREGKGVVEIEDDHLQWIVQFRQIAPFQIEILIDPWSDHGSIWSLNIETLIAEKVRDYRLDDEYSDKITW
jgi:hypothetical protein